MSKHRQVIEIRRSFCLEMIIEIWLEKIGNVNKWKSVALNYEFLINHAVAVEFVCI